MGISMYEFKTAMECLGAERVEDCKGSRYDVLVPCFFINGTKFFHSGTYYIVNREREISNDVMNKAMQMLGEKSPGGANFWYGEVHSVIGMLTLGTMLQGRYNKELVDRLYNETYKKILDSELIKTDKMFHFSEGCKSKKMLELRKLLLEYHQVVNPFCSGKAVKEPIDYFNKIEVKYGESNKPSVMLRLIAKNSHGESWFRQNDDGWGYQSVTFGQRERHNCSVMLYHYYDCSDKENPDEIIYLQMHIRNHNRSFGYDTPHDIDLNISLKTGLAWEEHKEEEAKYVTLEQLGIVTAQLKRAIKKLEKEISSTILK